MAMRAIGQSVVLQTDGLAYTLNIHAGKLIFHVAFSRSDGNGTSH
jgi:hypothetical protein